MRPAWPSDHRPAEQRNELASPHIPTQAQGTALYRLKSTLIGVKSTSKPLPQCTANVAEGHFRSNQPGFAFAPCRLRSESDRSAALPQSVAMVESRMGAVAWAIRQRSVSHPRSSNRTCGFPASGSPTGFVLRHTKQSTDRKRPLCGVLSFFASRYSFL
jgi:hypothetical protein